MHRSKGDDGSDESRSRMAQKAITGLALTWTEFSPAHQTLWKTCSSGDLRESRQPVRASVPTDGTHRSGAQQVRDLRNS